jgi:glutamate synthase domain-containing protein 3
MAGLKQFDLAEISVRELNQELHDAPAEAGLERIEIVNPDGMHSIVAGMDRAVDIEILGHAGYFTAGMNKLANVTVHGNTGWSVAENMMSGRVHVQGQASECAGASAHGGLLVIDGDASSRCGISLKGSDIVVGGSVGHFSAFMAQAGRLVICGDAGPNLGDSLYEAVIYVRGEIASLGADACQQPLDDEDRRQLAQLLEQAALDHDPASFTRIGSARQLYHWNADARQEY